MFKWLRKRWKDRKKPMGFSYPKDTRNADVMVGIEGDHVYEEIADPQLIELHRSYMATRSHHPLALQRSVSFQDVSRLSNNKTKEKNCRTMRNMRFNSSERLPTILSCASHSSSLANTPTNSMGNLHSREICLQLLPEERGNTNHTNHPHKDPKFRATPLHSNIYLPRKSATFASADSEMSRKRVKFQSTRGQGTDAEVIYSGTGSDSGYGFSNNNSTGSEEGDGQVRGSYDAYISKMEELLRLEKEVRDILKTIRGEDEPDDGYQNSRYFQENARFCEPDISRHGSIPSRKMNLHAQNSNGSRSSQHSSTRHNGLSHHIPLRRLSNKSISPDSFGGHLGTPQSSRVNSPLPRTPTNFKDKIINFPANSQTTCMCMTSNEVSNSGRNTPLNTRRYFAPDQCHNITQNPHGNNTTTHDFTHFYRDALSGEMRTDAPNDCNISRSRHRIKEIASQPPQQTRFPMHNNVTVYPCSKSNNVKTNQSIAGRTKPRRTDGMISPVLQTQLDFNNNLPCLHINYTENKKRPRSTCMQQSSQQTLPSLL